MNASTGRNRCPNGHVSLLRVAAVSLAGSPGWSPWYSCWWWAALWTFARIDGVEPTNNVSERALPPSVLWRKGSFGSDSEAGSRFAERLLSVAATCRQQGRSLVDFLVAAGEAALHGTAAPSLLPAGKGGQRV